MDKSDYRPGQRFTDDYFRWLEGQGLLCADDKVQGWQCNFLWLSLPQVHDGDESQAKESIEYVRQRYAGNYSEIWWMGEVEGTKKREAYHLLRNHARLAIEGIGEIFRAKEAIENNENDRAVIFLCNASGKLGAAHGLLMSMTDTHRKATRSARSAAIAKHSQPGGSHDKQEKIRAAWATGRYTSRARCAEEECAALDMSYDAARKALRNTPDPT